MSKKTIDEFSGVETTGHDWDGIQELNNPLPRWWLWTFYLTIIFSIGYVIYYPAIPLITEETKGISGITTRSNLALELAAAKASKAGLIAKVEEASVEEIAGDAELRRFHAPKRGY